MLNLWQFGQNLVTGSDVEGFFIELYDPGDFEN